MEFRVNESFSKSVRSSRVNFMKFLIWNASSRGLGRASFMPINLKLKILLASFSTYKIVCRRSLKRFNRAEAVTICGQIGVQVFLLRILCENLGRFWSKIKLCPNYKWSTNKVLLRTNCYKYIFSFNIFTIITYW